MELNVEGKIYDKETKLSEKERERERGWGEGKDVKMAAKRVDSFGVPPTSSIETQSPGKERARKKGEQSEIA